ncbi:uncharacterized protein LOC114352784 [Ostrinia furnacalis]|uniref:uncharacterized protein LOC114352784 n=1 Tax=Ostrinia furnacalis TaxID=93504 RepID=UPI00103C7426|nr:uncharacterized protein LOC114352784 [Ostrinia furnacalis]
MIFRVVFICLFAVLINAVNSAPPEEAKPLNCPAGEYYEKCKIAVCYKTCTDIQIPPPCPSIAAGCFMPECLCNEDTFRNKEGKCVTYDECLKMEH